jgi:hypothetical protein
MKKDNGFNRDQPIYPCTRLSRSSFKTYRFRLESARRNESVGSEPGTKVTASPTKSTSMLEALLSAWPRHIVRGEVSHQPGENCLNVLKILNIFRELPNNDKW